MPEHKEEMKLPPIEEQRAFVAQMKALEAEIEACSNADEKINLEKKKTDLLESMFGEKESNSEKI